MIVMIKGNVERVVVNEAQAARLKEKGFKHLSGELPKKEETKENKPYTEMSLEELKAAAKEKGLTGYSSLRKDDLIIILESGDVNDGAGEN